MSTPFPGMDPYLEHPFLWPGLHNRLIVALANQLQPRILPRYVASIEERVYLERSQHQRIPDIAVQKIRDHGGPVAVAAVDTPVILTVVELEIHEAYIELLDRYNAMKLVALIEVVSPSNKEPGPGRDAYLTKQRETLQRDCHLIEIDLLRRGRHVLSVPEATAAQEHPYAYLTCVSRWPHRNRFEVYPRALRERLPKVRLPLAEPDPDVALDVQAAVEQVYQEGGYAFRLRYDDPCEPPLTPEDQEWAHSCWLAYRAAHPELAPPLSGQPNGA